LDTFAEEFVRVPALMSGPDFSRNLARQSARRAAGAAAERRGTCDASSDASAASSRHRIEEAEKDQR